MADTQPNFPDVLGYVTDSERQTIGPVQVTLATRPRSVQAGQPFTVVILLQNTVDSHIDVGVSLQLPEKDAGGKKGNFTTKKQRLVVGVEATEVGFIRWPVSCNLKTAPGDDYVLGIEITPRVLNKKANPIRLPEGGGRFSPDTVEEKARQQLEVLRQLEFSTGRRSGFMRSSNMLETSFKVVAGKINKPLNADPQWVCIWALGKQSDAEPLIAQYGELMRVKVLPALKRQRLYEPLLEKTKERFQAAQYPLTESEASAIARLLTLVLEFGNSGDLIAQGGAPAGAYHVQSILSTKRLPGEIEERNMPRWAKAFLQAIAKDERVAGVPEKVIPAIAYDALLYDALMYSFQIVERDSGEDLGTSEEMAAYSEQVLKSLSPEGAMNFSYTYLPLVLGGIMTTDLMLMKGERLAEVMREIVHVIENRYDEHTEESDPIFHIAERLLEQTLRKYGILDSGR